MTNRNRLSFKNFSPLLFSAALLTAALSVQTLSASTPATAPSTVSEPAVATSAASKPAVTVIPVPTHATPGSGSYEFTARTTFATENREQAALARGFAALFTDPAGFTPRVRSGRNAQGDIRFVTDTTLSAEAYVLEIDADGMELRAADRRGFFYALQTLRQLLPAAVEGTTPMPGASWRVPALRIEDSPRFAYRGLMLDAARYFIPKEEVLRVIECMAQLKLNKLHLHLTDDNGWRLEIRRYPRLTQIGAWRVDRPGKLFPERRNPLPGEPTPVGGFYTQDDIREIVAFAGEREIEVIPEIDVPAHSNAALAAYPRYACPVVDRYIGVLPGLGGRNADIIFCAGNDKTYKFLENILDEVIDLFPSRYIHLGGDEARKTHWETCPLCQERIRQEGLASAEELQGYFMRRLSDYVRSKGREVIGWDELTNSRLPEDAVILGWQGYGQAALKAAAQGHRFVMTPARILYLIRYQGPQRFEPRTYFGNNTLQDVYDYEPVQASWPAEYVPLLQGVQASLWTEFCERPEDVEYLLFPRLAALAEVAWQPRGTKNWPDFLQRLDAYLPRLEAQEVIYARSMFNLQERIVPDAGGLRVELTCIRPDVEIRYTTDDTVPVATSPRYEAPLRVETSTTLRCATFRDGLRVGEVLDLPLYVNKATARPILPGGGEQYVLVNGLRGSDKYTDSEWCTWPTDREAAFTIDLEAREPLQRLTAGFITNYGMAVHLPSWIGVELSDDNRTFTTVAEQSFTAAEIFREGTFIDDVSFDLGGRTARYVRVRFRSAGPCPEDHVRPGQAAMCYVDEVIVE